MSDSNQSISGWDSGSKQSCPSNTGWIVGLVILFLIAIGLGIWLLVLYVGGHVGDSTDRLVVLPNAKITANANSVSGSWGKLEDDNDKVTMYVSEKPFVFNDDGTITVDGRNVLSDSQKGSTNTINLSVVTNKSYNAMLIATGNGTSHYKIFGPVKVFTQTTAELKDKLFNIRDLNECNGSVSKDATFTTSSIDVGIFRYGNPTAVTPTPNPPNTITDSFLVKYSNNTDETDMILCRIPGTSNINLGLWSNSGSPSEAPKICVSGTTDCSTTTDVTKIIPAENCQWAYNTNPSSVVGQNRWCLTTTQPVSLTNSTKQVVCMSRNGTALSASNPVGASEYPDTWFNSFIGPVPAQ